MKRKTAVLVGNILMALGLIVMIGSIALNLSSHIFSLNLPDMITMGSLFGIFVGAMIWLTGARIGVREKIADRYWLIKHYPHSNKDNHRYP
ncbi:stress-induced protein YchH [Providencia sp. PROV268]|uniref:stress-induced protein YchH n=1 Tax=Providencia sp. PROV268 TaxID=2949956 RepID=UPI00234BEAF2|nr:stress-induced protein YchH [Providencia sp. PROV268]